MVESFKRMTGIGEYRYRFQIISAGIAAGVLFACTPPPTEFTMARSYQREHFSGKDVSGKTIGLSMLISDPKGAVKKGIASSLVGTTARKNRPDLLFTEPDSVRAHMVKEVPEDSVEDFYHLLFKGDVPALQVHDSLWRSVGNDFLLAARLSHGMNIRTFNQMARKRILVEAELWDCREYEVVWRVSVNGQCSRAGYSDRQLLLDALSTVVAALPSAIPSYDSKSW